MDRIIFRLGLLGLFSGLLWPALTRAGEPTVRLIGPAGQIQAGTIIPVEIRLDTGGANINSAELNFRVTGEASDITHLGRESSIFTLWAETPTINGTLARFVGGRPGGIVAVDAVVGTISIIARQAGPVTISLLPTTSGLYRHDGVGTKITIPPASVVIQVADDLVPRLAITSTTHVSETDWGRAGDIQIDWRVEPTEQFSYRLSNDIGTVPDDDLELSAGPLTYNGLDDGVWYFVIKRRLPGAPWSPVYQRRFLLDRTPPEAFSLIQPDPAAVAGRVILTWIAIDRTSGEVSYQGIVGGKKIGMVMSPLTLQPDWRGQTVQIVALDAAGNQRLSETWRYGQARWPLPWWAWTIIAVVGLSLIGLLGFFSRLIRR